MTFESKDNPATMSNDSKKQENHKHQFCRDVTLGGELWTDGLICAFEFVRGNSKPLYSGSGSKVQSAQRQTHAVDKLQKLVFKSETQATDVDTLDIQSQSQEHHLGCSHLHERSSGNYWIPIGWNRISQLLDSVQVDAIWSSQAVEIDDEEDTTVADVAAPYWERPVGPTWWCHVNASHPFINSWLSNAQWLHPAINTALRDESKLISERMKHLLYEVTFLYSLSPCSRTNTIDYHSDAIVSYITI